MKLQDLEIHEDFKEALSGLDFDNLSEEKQKHALKMLDFFMLNMEKDDEKILNDWKAYINRQKLSNGSIENKAVIFC